MLAAKTELRNRSQLPFKCPVTLTVQGPVLSNTGARHEVVLGQVSALSLHRHLPHLLPRQWPVWRRTGFALAGPRGATARERLFSAGC